jgi:pyruvate kinase
MQVKIIATIGPATRSLVRVRSLVRAGMDIGRINMKHANLKEAKKVASWIKKSHAKVLVDVEHVKDLKLFKDLEFDYLALSFCENAKQIEDARKNFLKKINLIAKIESKNGVKNIEEIIKAADGVMVARGDLGRHVPLEKLPLFQKMIIKRCNKHRKFVITATEMLFSMTKNKIPERAEVSDVANAVLDGSNALMLSEETAIGKYPAHVVAVMQKIIKETLKKRQLS